ncbi:MAG: single-stranded DNA-binding protein [Chloroflexota bacterium]
MAKTLNRVQLIGHLGGDPELRHTANGMPVATFNIATNRQWPGKDGTLQEETEWHSIVVWDRLATICSEHLAKGRLVYIEGRIHTRSWESNGQKQYKTEIVASDMLILDTKQAAEALNGSSPAPARKSSEAAPSRPAARRGQAAVIDDDTDPDDLPF